MARKMDPIIISPLSTPIGYYVIPEEHFSVDIQEEASFYFKNIHTGVLSLDDAVRMLKLLRKSSVPREKKIFACMAQSLFDDYKFFPRYLNSELNITAVLFGSLIKHDLLSARVDANAKLLVYYALKHPVDSKVFLLGVLTLEQLMDTIGHDNTLFWFCVLKHTRLRQGRGDTVQSILRAVEKGRSSIWGLLLWKTAKFIMEHKLVSKLYVMLVDFINLLESRLEEEDLMAKPT